MSELTTKPIILLAFANEHIDHTRYLDKLPDELRRIWSAMTKAEEKGLCQPEMLPYATLSDIRDFFRKHGNRIVVFHFGGHADSNRLLFEGEGGQTAEIDAEGFAEFLAQQTGLQLVFLNACSTAGQVAALQAGGVPVVIATTQVVPDAEAFSFADEFYTSLATGTNSIKKAFDEATALVKAKHGGNIRNLRPAEPTQTSRVQPLWQIYTPPGADENAEWSLQIATGDPLFGLPPLPQLDLPETPYRHLDWFRSEDAEIFFGRGHEIAELYQQVTAPGGAPIILFYGQSGVGKSSVLAAGLLPRLEQKQAVSYQRRSQSKGLTSMLVDALHGADGSNLLAVWRAAEKRAEKPFTVVLDQVEELFTHPNHDLPDEMETFLTTLQGIFADQSKRPHGRLILSFRKEWLAEIEARLRERGLFWNQLFLERLDQAGIIEVIDKPASVPRLHKHYRLEVAPELPGLIAGELLADPGSPVAPMLQILLTELWKAAKQQNYDHPQLSQALYYELRTKGLGLDDFLQRQLNALREQQAEVVDSGLALDLLAYHTTPLGTAEQRQRDDLKETYSHQKEEVLCNLMQACRDLYLLVDPSTNHPGPMVDPSTNKPELPAASRLTHDTLAPHVRKRFAESDAPGQRARRILESQVVDWREGRDGMPLDDADLALVEAGSAGMRDWQKDERRLVDASHAACSLRKEEQQRVQQELEEARQREQAEGEVIAEFKHIQDEVETVELPPTLFDAEQAIADYTQAIELKYDPLSASYFNRGNAYFNLDEYEQAIADYSQAIDLKADPLSWPYNWRGNAYFNLEEYEKAITDYSQAIDLKYDPLSETYLHRGHAYASQGKYEQAIADFSKAIELDAKNAAAYNGLCWWASLTGQAETVVHGACQQAVELALPADLANFLDGRGLARALTGDYASALEDFRAYVEWGEQNGIFEEFLERRRTWIRQLEAGQNPFDAATLELLKRE